MRPYEALQRLWAQEEPPRRREISHGEAEVAALEARYRVRLPPDFRDYVLHACATRDDGGLMDDQFAAWWGLDRIRSVREEYLYRLTDPELEDARDTALFFADFANWAMAWAICCRPGSGFGRVFVVSGEDRVVADSFAAFVDGYARDNTELI